MNLTEQIAKINFEKNELIAYNFCIEKLHIKWPHIDSLEGYKKAKLQREALNGLVSYDPYPHTSGCVINITKKQVEEIMINILWEYAGVYVKDDNVVLYNKSKIFVSGNDCKTCGPENMGTHEQFFNQTRALGYDPNTLEALFVVKYLTDGEHNMIFHIDSKTNKEILIKNFYEKLSSIPQNYLKEIPNDVVEKYSHHFSSVYKKGGELFLELLF
jgi:hypothetical protein